MEKHLIQKIIISIILSLLIAFFATRYIGQKEETVNILVVKKYAAIGTIITEEHIGVEAMSKEFQEKYFPNVFKEDQLSGLLGNVALVPHKSEQPFLLDETKLGFKSRTIAILESAGAVDQSTLIPYNMRVISVTVDQSGSMNQSLNVGNYVDVIFTSNSTRTGGSYSRMVLQHAKVFDIFDIETSTNKVNQEVMLLVTPDQATIMASAKRNGVIDLILNPVNGQVRSNGPVFTSTFANYYGFQDDFVGSFKTVFNYLTSNNEFRRNVQFKIGGDFDLNKFNEMIQTIELDQFDLRELQEFMEAH